MVYLRILVHLNTHYLIYFYLEYEYITLAKRQPGIVLDYFARKKCQCLDKVM